jgi:arsenate reductase (thioredoxin)
MNVLFVCVQNAGRSQIAEALYAQAGGSARSAGTAPAERVHPEVVEVMHEVGVDLSTRIPHRLDESDVEWADVVVTMGCGDACPVLPGKRYLDWDLPDPSGRPPEEVRALREVIGRLVNELVSAGEKVVTAPRHPPS